MSRLADGDFTIPMFGDASKSPATLHALALAATADRSLSLGPVFSSVLISASSVGRTDGKSQHQRRCSDMHALVPFPPRFAPAACSQEGRHARERAIGAKTDLTEDEQSLLLEQYLIKTSHYQKKVKLDPSRNVLTKEERRQMWYEANKASAAVALEESANEASGLGNQRGVPAPRSQPDS
eukprot:1404263-Rhodomonas_salina.1